MPSEAAGSLPQAQLTGSVNGKEGAAASVVCRDDRGRAKIRTHELRVQNDDDVLLLTSPSRLYGWIA